jgi:hypothetical protein
MQTAKMPQYWWIAEENVVFIHNVYLYTIYIYINVYLYTVEFYSATKKNEILSFTSKWMELVTTILSEVSQTQKAKNCMFFLICRL